MTDILAVLKRGGGEGHPLITLDQQWAARAATTPVASAETG